MNIDNRCTLPWTWPSEIDLLQGTVATCCATPKVPLDPINGALTKQLVDLRTSILKNERNSQCASCWKNEDLGGGSKRLSHSQHLKENFDWSSVSPTDPIVNIGLTFSNKCQLMCAYCSPQISSTWENNKNHFNKFKEIKIIKNPINIDHILNDENLKWIHCTGGEPLLEEKCVNFLLKLPYNEHRNITLITNLSYGKAVFNNLLKIIEKHPYIGITCSLDAIGENISRKYLNWNLWEDNFKSLCSTFVDRKNKFPESYLDVQITISILNISNVKDVIKYCIEYKKKKIPIVFTLNYVDNPELNIKNHKINSYNTTVELTEDELKLLSKREISMIEKFNNILNHLSKNESLISSEFIDDYLKF